MMSYYYPSEHQQGSSSTIHPSQTTTSNGNKRRRSMRDERYYQEHHQMAGYAYPPPHFDASMEASSNHHQRTLSNGASMPYGHDAAAQWQGYMQMQLNSREVQWLELLYNRPSNKGEMDFWVEKVLMLSEPANLNSEDERVDANPSSKTTASSQTNQPVSTQSNQQDTTNEENNPDLLREENPDLLRFPCKARGVLNDHNSRTAYITVSTNANHGTTLVCTHPVCAKSGRKFRWCSVCQIPVAKRNFGKRHGHGLSTDGREQEPTDQEDQYGSTTTSTSTRQESDDGYDSTDDALRILEDSPENQAAMMMVSKSESGDGSLSRGNCYQR